MVRCTYERVYVVECQTPNYFYVGTTLREMFKRQHEHEAGHGAKWTIKHGFKRLLFNRLVPEGTSGTLEDDLTKYLMSVYGWGRVRGGNYVFVHCRNKNWLPLEFRNLRARDVLPLHLRPVSKFATELSRLVDAFEFSRSLHDADELNPDPFPEPVLGGLPQKEHHVLPAHAFAEPLGAD